MDCFIQPFQPLSYLYPANSNTLASKETNSTNRSQNALTGRRYYPVHNNDWCENNSPTNQFMPVQSSMNSSQSCYQFLPYEQRTLIFTSSAFHNPVTSQSNQSADNLINHSKQNQGNLKNSSKTPQKQRFHGKESQKAQQFRGYSKTYYRSQHYVTESILASFNEGKDLKGYSFDQFIDQFCEQTNSNEYRRIVKRNRSIAMTYFEDNAASFINFIRQKISNESAEIVGTSESKLDIPFSPSEDKMLLTAVNQYGTDNWDIIARAFPGRNAQQYCERWRYISIPEITTSKQTPEDDQLPFSPFQELGPKCENLPDHFEGDSVKFSYNTLHNICPMNAQSNNSAIQQVNTSEDEMPENSAIFPVFDAVTQTIDFADKSESDEPNWSLIKSFL